MSSWYFSVNRVCQGLCQDGFAAVPYSLYPIPDPAINLNTNPGTYFESRPGSKAIECRSNTDSDPKY